MILKLLLNIQAIQMILTKNTEEYNPNNNTL